MKIKKEMSHCRNSSKLY